MARHSSMSSLLTGVLSPLLVCLLAASSALAGVSVWAPDTAVVTTAGDQGWLAPAIAPDGAGGAYLAWWDRLKSLIYLRRLDPQGKRLWAGPRAVAGPRWERFEPALTEDGAGGVVAAWIEGRSGGCSAAFKAECDVYAQRFDGAGAPLWKANGVPVVKAPANQGTSGVALAPDGAGGVLLAWEDARPTCCKVYAQRLGPDGARLWGPDGVRVSPEPSLVIGPMDSAPQIVGDGQGGAFVAWIDNQNLQFPPMRVQRLDAQGQALWAEGGVAVGLPMHVSFRLTGDGKGGVLLAFTVRNAANLYDVAVQRVTAAGTPLWGGNGVLAAPGTYYQQVPDVVPDGTGGAIVAWVDHRYTGWQEDTDIRAQRVGADGTVRWGSKGLTICDLPGSQDTPRLTTDGAGGALLVWRDCRDYPEIADCRGGANLYGQHLTRSGQRLWPTDGAPISKARGNQGVDYGTPPRNSVEATTDGAGGAILAWPDGRNGPCDNAIWTTECDLYAQRANDALGAPPVADVTLEVSAQPSPLPASGPLTYTLTVGNLGPDTARGVKVVAPFPEHATLLQSAEGVRLVGQTLLVTLGSLDPGQTRQAQLVVGPLDAASIYLSARALAEAVDPAASNHTAALRTLRSGRNLRPEHPPAWTQPLIVSTGTGTGQDSASLRASDNLYVDWAVINDGAQGVDQVVCTELRVDGTPKREWCHPSLAPGRFVKVQDYALGKLPAGSHTLELVTDSAGAVLEASEADNRHTRTVEVAAD